MVDNYDISRNPSDLPKSKGVTSVRPGASRQHFLNFDDVTPISDNSNRQLTAYTWQNSKNEENKSEKQVEDLFSTEIDESVYERYPVEPFLPTQWTQGVTLRDTLKQVIDDHCNKFYDKAVEIMKNHKNYEEALININKCLLLKPFHIPYYETRSEIYLNLCDFSSSIVSLHKSILFTQATTANSGDNSRLSTYDPQQQQNEETRPLPSITPNLEDTLSNDKIAFLRYISGVTLFDQKLYLDALSIVATGANVFSTLPFQIYSILCLSALNKIDEACTLITQMIEQYSQNADLYVIRARLYYKDKNKLALCYYDLRDALAIQQNHSLANKMMNALKETAKNLRDNCIIMSLQERLNDAIVSINLAIQLYPDEADLYLQRSIIYRKMKKFELATDECLLVFDKIGHNKQDKLYEKTQQQFVFIYNECGLKCLQTGFYDDAIELLNRAINYEKTVGELYINRGDCFLAKGNITFALQDYEQALEITPNNNEIKLRISNVFFNNAERQYKEKRYQDSCVELTKAINMNPSVAKYYVSRSRVKYLTEDIIGAQQDIVAAILINPLEDGCIDVLPRLFVDTTLTDVLRSPMTKYVKENLLKRGVRLTIA